jgi:imidazolonepropionase-like amidohydrolase|tara:strand:+ start:1187 stop:2464 length:1278 start_codon:yes stop_codon:yes gene_type:complete
VRGEDQQLPEPAIFKASRVANPNNDGWLSDHAVITDEAGRIEAVLPSANLGDTSGKRTHDLGDVSLLPGLVEAHSHLHVSPDFDGFANITTETDDRMVMRAVGAARKALLSGVTTMRDIGSRNQVAFPVRDAIEAGVIPGPRLLLAGTPITTTAGHCWMFGTEADTLEDVVKAVRNQVKLGANVIKIMASGGNFTPTSNPRMTQYPAETLRAAVVEAERLGIYVVAHSHATAGIRNCIDAGIHQIIHCRWLSSDPTVAMDYDPEDASRLADEGRWVDPTIGLSVLGAEARAAGAPQRQIHWGVAAARPSPEQTIEVLQDMRARGVRYTTGLDMGMAFADYDKSAYNAISFVESLGYTPWEAVSASTSVTAEALRVDKNAGSLQPGKFADLMSVAGDPSKDIRALAMSADVVKGGVPVKLDGMALI